MALALIDAKGCVKVRQKIKGTFQNPVAEPPDRLASLGGPVLKLLKQGTDVLSGAKCDVFYAGSVAAPK